MKAITLWQPWAGAMAHSLKLNETRSWGTNYRGALAICAAARPVRNQELQTLPPFNFEIVYGSILCIVHIYECIPTNWPEMLALDGVTDSERAWGDYGPNRFAWKTRGLVNLKWPVPTKGRQGLFNINPDLELDIWDARIATQSPPSNPNSPQ